MKYNWVDKQSAKPKPRLHFFLWIKREESALSNSSRGNTMKWLWNGFATSRQASTWSAALLAGGRECEAQLCLSESEFERVWALQHPGWHFISALAPPWDIPLCTATETTFACLFVTAILSRCDSALQAVHQVSVDLHNNDFAESKTHACMTWINTMWSSCITSNNWDGGFSEITDQKFRVSAMWCGNTNTMTYIWILRGLVRNDEYSVVSIYTLLSALMWQNPTHLTLQAEEGKYYVICIAIHYSQWFPYSRVVWWPGQEDPLVALVVSGVQSVQNVAGQVILEERQH